MTLGQEATQLEQLLGLKSPPIAITFRTEAPAGVTRIKEIAPSGCTYWKLAAEGNIFYTEASDHFGCLIGAYTHSVSLPPAQDKELEGMIETMVGLNYLNMVEVPSIPRREEPLASPSTLRWCRNFSTRCRRRARQCKADDVAL